MPKKIKKKEIKRNKNKLLGCGLILLLLVVVTIVVISFINSKEIYKIEDRSKEIEEKHKEFEEDVVGWLRVQGTNIDYPIIYNSNDTELTTIIKDYVWTNTIDKKLENRMMVVGHNILNVSKNPLVGDEAHTRFEQLLGFIYPEFLEENKYVQYTIGENNYLYKIFSVSFVDNDEVDYYDHTYEKKELDKYITQALEDSYFKFDVDVNSSDDIITLVTCTRMFGEDADKTFKIEARRLRDGEKASNYSFKVKENYKEIEEIMKGEEENEKA